MAPLRLVPDNESICEYLLPFEIYSKVQDTFWTPCILEPGREEEFLLAEVIFGDNQCILIFACEYHSYWSDQITESFLDAPPLFNQIYVISAKRGGYVFPVLYVLLPNKQSVTHIHLFATVKVVI